MEGFPTQIGKSSWVGNAVEEQALLQEGQVSVTRSRIVIANQTYPVANITSIRTNIALPDRKAPIVLDIPSCWIS